MTGGPKPQLLAAIDVGTNSFHLVIARVSSSGRIEVITREREMVRLGKGAGEMKELSPEAIDRGIGALRRMKLLADGAGAPLRAIATSAVREATNAAAFVDRARIEAGVEIEVVSGVEEARLIHLGVLQGLPVFERPLLLCDIGGGSTELLLGHRGEVLVADRVPIRAGYRIDAGMKTHAASLGVGYVDRKFSVDLAGRRDVVAERPATFISLGLRFFIDAGGTGSGDSGETF